MTRSYHRSLQNDQGRSLLNLLTSRGHEATPEGWYVGRPSEHPERAEWVMFAFDTRKRAIEGKRTGEWTTVAPTESEVVRSTAHCMHELGEGRWPT